MTFFYYFRLTFIFIDLSMCFDLFLRNSNVVKCLCWEFSIYVDGVRFFRRPVFEMSTKWPLVNDYQNFLFLKHLDDDKLILHLIS